MAEQQFPLAQIEASFRAALQRSPRILGNDAVNFFLDRFKEQSWLGATREPWAQRSTNTWKKKNRTGRSILVDTGRMRRATKIVNATTDTITIGNDVPYARAHNEGFKGQVTQRVSAFTRKGRNGQRVSVKAHTRTVNQNIPKRQFMGYSPVLDKQLRERLQAELMKGINGFMISI